MCGSTVTNKTLQGEVGRVQIKIFTLTKSRATASNKYKEVLIKKWDKQSKKRYAALLRNNKPKYTPSAARRAFDKTNIFWNTN